MSVTTQTIVHVDHEPGKLATREDDVAMEILDVMFKVLLDQGQVILCDPKEALNSRVRFPGDNLTDRLTRWVVGRRPMGVSYNQVLSWFALKSCRCVRVGVLAGSSPTQVLWASPTGDDLLHQLQKDHHLGLL